MGPGETLALKLVLTPLLVGGASLAARRWGSEVGGWLVGIPLTSAPVTFFLAIGPGPDFAAQAAVGILAGTISQAAFALAYAWGARKFSWEVCLATATIGFVVVTAVMLALTGGPLVTFAIAVIASLALMPRRSARRSQPVPLPRWMVVATALVVGLTSAAPLLGPRLAGLITPYPLYAAVLAVFAHRMQGAGAAAGVLRGLLLGLFAFAGFFLVIALYLEPLGISLAFAAAIVVALTVQGATLFAGRRLALA